MTFCTFYRLAPVLAFLPTLLAQSNPILTVAPAQTVSGKRGGDLSAKISVELRPGFHVNSNTPNESYLIPLKLTWTPGPVQGASVEYPKPHDEKYDFSEKPLSVYTGNFDIVNKFKVPADAPQGPAIVLGKLRYQACNNNACFPPKTVEIKLPVEIQ
jgi:hypothetical protein